MGYLPGYIPHAGCSSRLSRLVLCTAVDSSQTGPRARQWWLALIKPSGRRSRRYSEVMLRQCGLPERRWSVCEGQAPWARQFLCGCTARPSRNKSIVYAPWTESFHTDAITGLGQALVAWSITPWLPLHVCKTRTVPVSQALGSSLWR
jgi:hypothetical protein